MALFESCRKRGDEATGLDDEDDDGREDNDEGGIGNL